MRNRNKRRPPQTSTVRVIELYCHQVQVMVLANHNIGKQRDEVVSGRFMTRFHFWMVCFRESNEILRSKLQNMPKLEVRIMVFALIFGEFFNACFAFDFQSPDSLVKKWRKFSTCQRSIPKQIIKSVAGALFFPSPERPGSKLINRGSPVGRFPALNGGCMIMSRVPPFTVF